ncbi:hypothetical protein [Brevibacillus laterosporus]|uniref:hypothetical protein n=1 Tax=Brevibacillus laterosporus TaxID=1465 RepID=UPI0018F8A9F8|nr:hypothetical protein [Brevibacillus laterosporus]MBG9776243.1 hypothetical protein [Brevibacillus laterosporus]
MFHHVGYGVTLIKKLKLKEPEEILRRQELKQEWSELRFELISEAKRILNKKSPNQEDSDVNNAIDTPYGTIFMKDYFTLVPS